MRRLSATFSNCMNLLTMSRPLIPEFLGTMPMTIAGTQCLSRHDRKRLERQHEAFGVS
jgi:hypothetical protein